jgi:hypothetical protein
MKPNVDLTMDRDFRRRYNIRDLAAMLSNRLGTHILLPWNYESYDGSDRDLVLTGNREVRQRKIRGQLYEEGGSCERCGYDMTKKPWHGSWGLCDRCDAVLSAEYDSDGELLVFRQKIRQA